MHRCLDSLNAEVLNLQAEASIIHEAVNYVFYYELKHGDEVSKPEGCIFAKIQGAMNSNFYFSFLHQ